MNPLDQLKDIHLPSGISWWPLAVGWWIMALLVLIILMCSFFLFKSYRTKKHKLSLAMTPFEQLVNDTSLSSQDWLNELSALLRRIAINVHGRNDVAGLVGQQWLSYLDHSGNTQAFSQGVGKVLATQPYQIMVDYDRDAVITLTRGWVKAQYKRGHHA